jgi:putative protease
LRLHGYDRAVLAREMPLREIAECAEEGVDIEAFGHGALCGACSGQCLFSSMVGGRSGNRGMCAQPCRLPYRLGEKAGYLLSPKDLMTLRHLPDLQRAA